MPIPSGDIPEMRRKLEEFGNKFTSEEFPRKRTREERMRRIIQQISPPLKKGLWFLFPERNIYPSIVHVNVLIIILLQETERIKEKPERDFVLNCLSVVVDCRRQKQRICVLSPSSLCAGVLLNGMAVATLCSVQSVSVTLFDMGCH